LNIQLRQVDRLEVVVLVDNYCDELLEDSEIVKRPHVASPNAPMAEPGFSLLIKVHKNGEDHTILMDTGISGECLRHNINLLSTSKAFVEKVVTADVRDVESVVISHGHSDHFNGLKIFLEMFRKNIPVIVHPSASVKRRFKHSSGTYEPMIPFDELLVKNLGATIENRAQASTVAAGLILVSGQIERKNNFEIGSLSLEAKVGDRWGTDPFHDDQAIAIHVKNKGLVVISGCSHAGIINTVNYIKKVSGIDKVHGVMGGFHLPGPDMSTARSTIAEMKKFALDYIIPMHCTGWNAINLFSSEMPGQFILNSVGTTYLFGSKNINVKQGATQLEKNIKPRGRSK
jgi:7,8-dihydropterin-6-yl-methyl-4-(beta-D-ribofuranosyl)aminobenzene 5'-phosphate synthase